MKYKNTTGVILITPSVSNNFPLGQEMLASGIYIDLIQTIHTVFRRNYSFRNSNQIY